MAVRRKKDDVFFKTMMGYPEVAEDFLKAHLPKDLLSELDWSTLKLESGMLPNLKSQVSHTDILYRAQFKESARCFYFLVEHQSRPDAHMAYRFQVYISLIYQQHMRQDPEALQKPFPLCVPILLYNGKKAYPYPLGFEKLFGPYALFMQRFINQSCVLVDLSIWEDKDLLSHGHAGLLEISLKARLRRDAIEAEIGAQFQRIAMLLTDVSAERVPSLLELVLYYHW